MSAYHYQPSAGPTPTPPTPPPAPPQPPIDWPNFLSVLNDLVSKSDVLINKMPLDNLPNQFGLLVNTITNTLNHTDQVLTKANLLMNVLIIFIFGGLLLGIMWFVLSRQNHYT